MRVRVRVKCAGARAAAAAAALSFAASRPHRLPGFISPLFFRGF